MNRYTRRNDQGMVVIRPTAEVCKLWMTAASEDENTYRGCPVYDLYLAGIACRIINGDTTAYDEYMQNSGCKLLTA